MAKATKIPFKYLVVTDEYAREARFFMDFEDMRGWATEAVDYGDLALNEEINAWRIDGELVVLVPEININIKDD